jgi:hypothetical protein
MLGFDVPANSTAQEVFRQHLIDQTGWHDTGLDEDKALLTVTA